MALGLEETTFKCANNQSFLESLTQLPMDRLIVLGLLMVATLVMISDARHASLDSAALDEDDDELELSGMAARSFLDLRPTHHLDKATINSAECVLCKFNMMPCCKPNLCVKKRFRPDECLELKPR